VHSCLRQSLLWALRLMTQYKPTLYFTMTRQHYIHSSLDVILCLPLHVHDHVENVPKHVFFYVHDVKVMAEEIGLPKRNLLENTSLYLVMGQTKTRKLLLTGLETNTMSPCSNTTSYNSSLERRRSATSFSTLLTKKSFLFFLYL